MKKITPFLLVLILGAVVGYYVYDLMTQKNMADARSDTQLIIPKAQTIVTEEMSQWRKMADSSSHLNNNDYFQSLVEIKNDSIDAFKTLSFGEQSLVIKAISSKQETSDFVVASDAVPKHLTEKSKFVYTIVKPTDHAHLLITRVALSNLSTKLNALNTSYVAVSVTAQNNAAQLITPETSFKNNGESLDMPTKGVSLNTSYQINPKGLSALLIGLCSALLVVLIGWILFTIKLIKNRNTEKSSADEMLPATSMPEIITPKTEVAQTEVDVSSLPITPVEDNKEQSSGKEPDDLLDLESEIKSKEEDVAKFRAGSEDESPKAVTDNQPMEFTGINAELEKAVDPKEKLADAELDDGNIILFDTQAEASLTEYKQSSSAQIDDSGYRTYDVRCDESVLDTDFIKRFAITYKNQLKDASMVVVGRDVRESSSRIANQLIGTLTNLGLSVIDVGLVTTPALAFATQSFGNNGIMVTASHCAPNENGFKWIVNGLSPTADDVSKFRSHAESIDEASLAEVSDSVLENLTRQTSIKENYCNAIDDDIMLVEAPSVCVDALHGAASPFITNVLENAGAEFTIINDNIDGNFSTGNPNPYEANRLKNLQEAVTSNQQDVGIAFDADGDRLAVVDDKGRVLTAESLIAIFAMIVLETHQSSRVIYDVKCSKAVAINITAAGGLPTLFPTGSANMRHALKNSNTEAVFAGEYSGHFIFNDDRFMVYDDAVYAAMRLLEFLSQTEKSLSQIVDELCHFKGTDDIYYDIKQASAPELLQKIKDNWQAHSSNDALAQYSLNELDGFRLESANSFGLIRQSNTSNSLTIRISAKTDEAYKHIAVVFRELTKNTEESLSSLFNQL